ncbi:PAB-dependent poly(A)-specific ribonuclease subunit PAN3 [Lasiosphaeria miniovina]|uniref:PAN2-PAN3 deadenylation complex subunit PAN3 n=1 Tax=Lasiosphaeria miniovina TaxID=1954250 RepID=A0AA40DZH8_9PEZI|nr:PAB-dependent poly(A)-specific ribonuclease subunit PAN3 [Lasiosphaeria miniovina]KAK0717198.1 PAB-dependent poly(A)-specific ribonuclease subunit PAN3 [Lasiosphaeria miniovina]
MATTRYTANDLRRQVGSPRSKGRENKDTLCRNVVIYGNCRYEDQGCTFNHDQNKMSSSQTDLTSKKTFNVDSPSFTPAGQPQPPAKKSTFSSQAASAAPFTPRGANVTPNLQQQATAETSIFNPAAIREFTPQNYDIGNTNSVNGAAQDSVYNDPFTSMNSLGPALPPAGQFNPYANDHSTMGGSGATFYPQHGSFPAGLTQPPNYHLYTPYDSYRQDLQPWQRSTYDFFMPEKMREHMQKKMYATQQVMPSLPQLERWHSLVPLDTNNRKNSSSFGYPSWMYKAQNSRTGRHYALRRIEGYRLTNDKAITTAMKEWKKIKNANIVTVHDIFTTREFGDSSLIFAYDYHPLSATLQEHHFPSHGPRFRALNFIPENVLWGYICQITNALRIIHSSKLAARCLELSKIIVSEKDRIRLAACSILDVVQFETNTRSILELQQEDLIKFGRVMLSLATNTLPVHLNNIQAALDSLGTKYTSNLKEAIAWLISPVGPGELKPFDNFITGISTQMTAFFDLALQDGDEKESILAKELENGRVARLLMKLATITERGDLAGMQGWSETGDRYQLKLFRDYVFHQVDADGKPRLSIGHILNCLNKLDAGLEEMVVLTSRDNDNVFVLTYRELRQMFERSFNELVKHSKHGAPGAN